MYSWYSEVISVLAVAMSESISLCKSDTAWFKASEDAFVLRFSVIGDNLLSISAEL